MTPARKYLLGALSLGGIALVAFWLREPSAASEVHIRPAMSVRMPRPPARLAGPSITVLSISREAARLNSPEQSVEDDLATLDLVISCYRRQHDGNPVGSNEEITAALCGRNPRNLAYLPREGSFLGDHRQLVDRWGSPYFFHALARDRLDIRSAGPDRVFWTNDDIVCRPGR